MDSFLVFHILFLLIRLLEILYSMTRMTIFGLEWCPLESCEARFLAPWPCNAPLSFAPTLTGPKNSTFYSPDPRLTRLYSAWTIPNWIKTIYHQSEITSIRLQQTHECTLQWSNNIINMVIRENNHSSCSVWEWKAYFSLKYKFISKILGENCLIPMSKIPWPGLTRIKLSDPTQKSVRGGGGGTLGFQVTLQVCNAHCRHTFGHLVDVVPKSMVLFWMILTQWVVVWWYT